MSFNMQNFAKIMAIIEANPERWTQMDFHCGTAHCVAGWAQALLNAERHGVMVDDFVAKTCLISLEDATEEYLGIDIAPVSVSSYAYIFDPDTSLDDLRAVLRGERNPETGAVL